MDSPGVSFISNYVTPMEKSVKRMSVLTEQLLAYARGGKYQPQKIQLNALIEGVSSQFDNAVGPLVSLTTDLSCHAVSVEGDENQLRVALTAALTNAVEAIEKQGTIRVQCRKEQLSGKAQIGDLSLPAGEYAWLTITDDGMGMEEQARRRIFEPFFTTKVYGRGLGMAAVYGIIKNHDGGVEVFSEPGKGTTVHIYLPAV